MAAWASLLKELYPRDMTADEHRAWVKSLPPDHSELTAWRPLLCWVGCGTRLSRSCRRDRYNANPICLSCYVTRHKMQNIGSLSGWARLP